MANVFVSHSSADNDWAERIHDWLSQDGHEVFLDYDKHDGIPAGDEWEARLYERLRWADAVVCVVTPSYLKSVWCAAEIGAARALGSELLPVRASSEHLDDRLLKLKQHVDVVRDECDAHERLRQQLAVIDGSGGRGWPDDRSPYPGLRALELDEHRVFFGRASEIKGITERLRSPAERAARAILTVVGPSGCGKSSLIRAGVLPRLACAKDWLAAPPITPGIDPVGNLARAIAAVTRERHIPYEVTSLRKDLGSGELNSVATDLLLAAGVESQCKLLLVIDQFEELLTQTEPDARAEFAATLQPALGGAVQVLATLRPEFLEPLFKDPDLSKIALRMHQVRPLESDALRSVIEGPAKVAGFSFEEDLVTRLVADTGTGDALPLLAFTLEQLTHDVRRGGRLTHQRYADIGGVRGALQRQADDALKDVCSKTGVTDDQVITALLNLVTIDEQGRPTKRHMSLDELSSGIADQLEPFVTRRLLAVEAEGERTFVAVSHEAFLANWPPLKDEIDAEVTALRARRVVENAANDWVASGRDHRGLLQGGQLAKTKVDTGAEMERDSKNAPTQTDVLTQRLKRPTWWPGRRRLVTRVDLNEIGEEFLAASIHSDRSRRRRTTMRVVAVIAILAIAAVIAAVRSVQATSAQHQAQHTARQAIAAKLVAQSRAMLGGSRVGGDRRAIQQMVAAEELVPESDPDSLLNTLIDTRRLQRVIKVPSNVSGVGVSPDGRQIVSAGDDGLIRRWDLESGKPVGDPLAGHTGKALGAAYIRDGRWIATSGTDKTVRMWDAKTGAAVHVLAGQLDLDHVTSAAWSLDGELLATGNRDGTVQLWKVETGKQMGEPIRADNGWVSAVEFSPDGTRLVTGGTDGAMRMWNVSTHQPGGPPLPSHKGPVLDVDFSHDGQRIGSMSYLIDSDLRGAATSPDGARATGGLQLRITDGSSGRPIVDGLTELGYVANDLALSPDGRRVAIGSADGKIYVFDADTGAEVKPPLSGHTGAVNMVTYSDDGTRIISAGDNTIHVWAAEPDQGIGTRLPGLAFRGSLPAAVSPDGRVAATRDANNQSDIALWRIDTGKLIRTISTGQLGPVSALAWRPDGQAIASADGTANTVRFWNAQTGEPDGPTLTGPTNRIHTLSFSPDGHHLACLFVGSDPWLWDISAGPPRATVLHGKEDFVGSVGFSGDGHRLITFAPMHTSGDSGAVMETGNIFDVSSDMTPSAVRVWDTDTGGPAGPPIIGRGGRPMDLAEREVEVPIFAAAISPDGQRVLVSTIKGLRLHDVATGQPVGEPWTDTTSGGNNPAVGLAFSADGSYVVSVDRQTSVLRFREVKTGRPVGNPLIGHTGVVFGVAFTADGHHIVSRGGDDGWMLWPGPHSWRDALCDKLTANMTRTEWDEWVSPTIEYRAPCPLLPSP